MECNNYEISKQLIVENSLKACSPFSTFCNVFPPNIVLTLLFATNLTHLYALFDSQQQTWQFSLIFLSFLISNNQKKNHKAQNMAGGNNKNKNKQAKAVKKVIPNFDFVFNNQLDSDQFLTTHNIHTFDEKPK